MLFCAAFFPVSDSDALASYVARFLYKRFGPLEEVGTLSIQWTFPETFDRLIWLFARTGYAAAVPAFACFVTILVCALREAPREARFWVLVLVLTSPVLLTQALSQKNDVAVAALAVLAVHWMTRHRGAVAIPLVLLCCALLVGTKWNAIPLALLLLVALGWTAVRRRWRLSAGGVLVVVAVLPLLYVAASGDVYLRNYCRYGSLLPMPADVGRFDVAWSSANLTTIPEEVAKIAYASLLDVARCPLLFFRRSTGWDGLEVLSLSNSVPLLRDWHVTSHSSIGLMFVPTLLVALLALFGRSTALRPYRLHAAIALGYALVVLATLHVTIGTSRYLLPSCALMLAPTGIVLDRCFRGRLGRATTAWLAVYVSATTMVFSNDRPLPLPVHVEKPSFVRYRNDRDTLMLLGLASHIPFYHEFRARVPQQASLLVVDNATQEDLDACEIPHFYPYLLRREPANTRIVHLRTGPLPELEPFDFILIYSRRGRDPDFPHYRLAATTGWPGMNLYSRTSCGSPTRLIEGGALAAPARAQGIAWRASTELSDAAGIPGGIGPPHPPRSDDPTLRRLLRRKILVDPAQSVEAVKDFDAAIVVEPSSGQVLEISFTRRDPARQPQDRPDRRRQSGRRVKPLCDHALQRAARGGVELLRDAAGEMGQPAGLGGQAHGPGHPHRVLGAGDAGVQQHPVHAQLHGDRHVAGRAHAGVDDDRVLGIALLEVFEADADGVGVEDPLARADRAPRRHHAGGPRLFELPGDHGVVGRVDQDLEPFGHQLPGGLEGGDRVGQEGLGVPEDLELHPIRARIAHLGEDLPSQPGNANRVFRGVAPRRVGQDRVPRGVDIIQQVLARGVDQPLPADRHRNALRRRDRQALLHHLVAGVLSGADDQAAGKGVGTDPQRVAGGGLLGHRAILLRRG